MATQQSPLHNIIFYTANVVEEPLDRYRQLWPGNSSALPPILVKLRKLKDALVRFESDVERKNLDFLDHDTKTRQQRLLEDCQRLANQVKRTLDGRQIPADAASIEELDRLIYLVGDSREWFKSILTAFEGSDGYIARLQTEQRALRAQIENLKAERTTLQNKVKDLEDENATRTARNEQSKSQQHDLITEMKSLTLDNAQLEEKYQTIKHNDQTKLRQLNKLASAIMDLGVRYPDSRPNMTSEEISANMSLFLERLENCSQKMRDKKEARPMSIHLRPQSPPSSRPETPSDFGRPPLTTGLSSSPTYSTSTGGRSSDGEKRTSQYLDRKNQQWVRPKKT